MDSVELTLSQPVLHCGHDEGGGAIEFFQRHGFSFQSWVVVYRNWFILTAPGGYLACFFVNRTLDVMLIAAMPSKKITRAESSPPDIFPTRNRTYPTTRLNSAQTTFTVGDDNPFPGG